MEMCDVQEVRYGRAPVDEYLQVSVSGSFFCLTSQLSSFLPTFFVHFSEKEGNFTVHH